MAEQKDAQILAARLGTGPSEVSLRWGMEPLLAGEFELFDSFLRVDMAHTVMLGECRILTPAHTADILRALREVRDDGGRIAHAPDPSLATFQVVVTG